MGCIFDERLRSRNCRRGILGNSGEGLFVNFSLIVFFWEEGFKLRSEFIIAFFRVILFYDHVRAIFISNTITLKNHA